MIIGIGGISRSGKSTLSTFLQKALQQQTYVIHLDHYIKDASHWNFFMKYPVFYLSKLNKRFNMEHPHTIDFDRLYADILSSSLENEIVIAEGFLITYDKRIRHLLNKYIHLNLSKEEFLKRRMHDFRKSNRWYALHVWDSFMKYGNNYQGLDHMVVHVDHKINKDAILPFLNSDVAKQALAV